MTRLQKEMRRNKRWQTRASLPYSIVRAMQEAHISPRGEHAFYLSCPGSPYKGIRRAHISIARYIRGCADFQRLPR